MGNTHFLCKVLLVQAPTSISMVVSIKYAQKFVLPKIQAYVFFTAVDGRQLIGGNVPRTSIADYFSISLAAYHIYQLQFAFTGPIANITLLWKPPGSAAYSPFLDSYYSSEGIDMPTPPSQPHYQHF